MHIMGGEMMPRPKKCRRIGFIPQNECFAPCGKGGARGEVVISIEEMEALRLSDLERLDQNACAEQMGISRGTFQRIINSARQKTANALVNVWSIRIDTGLLAEDERTLICRSCGHTWKEICKRQISEQCSACGCTDLAYISEQDCCLKHSTSCLERKGNNKK